MYTGELFSIVLSQRLTLQSYDLSNLEMTLNCDERLSVDSNADTLKATKIYFTTQRIVIMLLLVFSCCKPLRIVSGI